ncbi:catalase-related immune-responsive protein [Streptomyces sp. TLI_235]|nr:catalase-related immune-responsive protein [Streptomyces sp. TLI_235]
MHSLVWEEAQLIAGTDPDFHRRDLADAIEAGCFPEWELGIQTFPDTPEQTFADIDLLDPTKIVPEELAPVQPVGLLTLNANPTNFFAETEQVAFHPGHLVPGIDVTDDPLLAGRLFSYLDTQITRLGGPNFAQIPINRPHAPINDMLRDGFHQDAVHSGVAPYKPNSLDGGCPFFAGPGEHAFIEHPVPIAAAAKVREAPASFADRFSQPRLFWLSMSPVEREHVIAAYTFELSKVYEQAIKERVLEVLARVDEGLCRQVAQGLGLPAPQAPASGVVQAAPSPALSPVGQRWPATGRVLGILTATTSDAGVVRQLREAARDAGLMPLIIAPLERRRRTTSPCSGPTPRPGPSSSTPSSWPARPRAAPTTTAPGTPNPAPSPAANPPSTPAPFSWSTRPTGTPNPSPALRMPAACGRQRASIRKRPACSPRPTRPMPSPPWWRSSARTGYGNASRQRRTEPSLLMASPPRARDRPEPRRRTPAGLRR